MNDTKIPFSALILSGITVALLLPYLPIDETRYLTVAWEMKLNDSFIVPLLNGSPYSHKPPLLFWLINLNWLIFGVNGATLRLIPLVFGVLNIVMVYKIALLLWADKKIAKYATLILASTLLYLLWSALIMFDIILTFWILLGIFGLFSATENVKLKPWFLVAISIGGGLLTKGPAIFVHILPVALLGFLWIPKDKLKLRDWYLKLFFSLILGVFIALLWAIPAAMMGGETYKKAILWGQTTSRMVSSFAHQRPIWYYTVLLPVLVLPWCFVKPAWINISKIKQDCGSYFLALWACSTVLLFSLISGKQIHYVIPMIPALSLLIAKNMAVKSQNIQGQTKLHYPVAIFYIFLGIAIMFVPYFNLGNDIGEMSQSMLLSITLGWVFLGLGMLFIKITSMEKLIKVVSTSSAIFVLVIILAGSKAINHYDLHEFSLVLKEKQKAGYEIINYEKYHGQYHFLGRLKTPLVVFRGKVDVREYIKTHKKVLLIDYDKRKKKVFDDDEVLYEQLYRGKNIILLNEKGIQRFLTIL